VTLTGLIASLGEWHVPKTDAQVAPHSAFAGVYLLINGIGSLLDRTEQRFARSSLTLPTKLLLVARRPLGGPRS
jgi:hypothetical protein